MVTSHDFVSHAAHYMYGQGGHDLERWVIRANVRPSPEQISALGIASDAEYHSGFVSEGAQHWVFLARRPLSPGECSLCTRKAVR